jgi:hypothetical protein
MGKGVEHRPLSLHKPFEGGLSLPGVLKYGPDIKIVFFSQTFPCLSNLINYGIFIHGAIPPLVPLDCG